MYQKIKRYQILTNKQDCLKQLIQLFEAILPCTDDQIFDLNKRTQRI